jgi:hypothetical protein
MIRKIFMLLLLISIIMVPVSCGTSYKKDVMNDGEDTLKYTNNPEIYKTIESIYTEKNIKIRFPQVTGLDSSLNQKTINDLIKSEALKVLDYYRENIDNLRLEIDYNIKWKGQYLLSIQYSGLGYVKGAAYPNNLFYTTNINIVRGSKVKLKDLVNLDGSFIAKLKSGEYKAFDPGLNIESVVRDELDQYGVDDLIAYLKSADEMSMGNMLNAFSYFTEDSLGISIGTAHVLGDHAEFELKYDCIKDNIQPGNEIWRDFSRIFAAGQGI